MVLTLTPVAYSILFYTASFGKDYRSITSDWCASLERTLIKPLNRKTNPEYHASHVVLSDAKTLDHCNVLNVGIHQEKHVDAKRQIRIKLLKMYSFESVGNRDSARERFMWLDVDIRPTPKSVDLIQEALSLPIHLRKGIALTRTKKHEKHRFNGGLFMYAGRTCLNYWKYLVLKNLTVDTRGRDQPYLKEATESRNCVVTVLPDMTQGFVSSLWTSKGDSLSDYAFIHFTGQSKDSPMLMSALRLLKYY